MDDMSRLLGESTGKRLHELLINPTMPARLSGARAWLIRTARRFETWHDNQARVWEDIASRLER